MAMLSFTSHDGGRWGLTGVDGGRVPGKFPQKRASTGGATPSRLAAVMERWSVGEVLKFGSPKVLKLWLPPVPNHPASRACTSSRYSNRKAGRAARG